MPPRILLVDDEPSIRRLVTRILSTSGFEVVEAACGRDAIKLFEADPDPIDAVVTDLRMPDGDGLHVIDTLRGQRPALPILCLTGFAERLPVSDVPVLRKPFTPDELVERLRRVLEQAQQG